MKERKCPICGEKFKPKHPRSKYCKGKCKLIARKRQLRQSDRKRRQTNQRRDYMMDYMWEYRKHRYRPSALNTNTIVRGTDTPSVDIPSTNPKLMANSII